MEKIPIAEEFFKNNSTDKQGGLKSAYEVAIEFTKLHVKGALEAANKATKKQEWIDNFINLENRKCKKAIMESYPENLIQ